METTNFFTQIAQLDISGQIVLTIAKGADGKLIVSTFVRCSSPSEQANSRIIPYNLTADAQELDKCYFERITTPVQKAGEVLDNMEQYMKSLEKTAQKPAKHSVSSTPKEKTETDKRTKKYHDAMSRADELEKIGKFSDAWSALPKTSEYPEHAETIKSRQGILEAKIWPDLFGKNAIEEEKEQEQEIIQSADETDENV